LTNAGGAIFLYPNQQGDDLSIHVFRAIGYNATNYPITDDKQLTHKKYVNDTIVATRLSAFALPNANVSMNNFRL
jgi:hypothetical protein